MDGRSWWDRLDAEEWVHRVAVAQTLLLAVWLVWACVLAYSAGMPVLVLIPGAVVAASGWFTAAWSRGPSWTWWAWTVWAGLWLLSGLVGVLGGALGWQAFVQLAYGGLLLTFLCHPDSRARIDAPGVDRRPTRDATAQWVGRDY